MLEAVVIGVVPWLFRVEMVGDYECWVMGLGRAVARVALKGDMIIVDEVMGIGRWEYSLWYPGCIWGLRWRLFWVCWGGVFYVEDWFDLGAIFLGVVFFIVGVGAIGGLLSCLLFYVEGWLYGW